MSEFKLHIKKGGYVSKELLLAYLNNELNASDTQHVEHLIAEDPFLQDAIEGLKGADTKKVDEVLNTIFNNVDILTGEKKPVTMSVFIKKYAAAAMLLVFFGLTFLIMNQLNKKQTADTIAIEPAIQNSDTKSAETELDGMGGGTIANDTIISSPLTAQPEIKIITNENNNTTTTKDAPVSTDATKYTYDEIVLGDDLGNAQEDLSINSGAYTEKEEAEISTNTTFFSSPELLNVSTTGPVVTYQVYTDVAVLESKSSKKALDNKTPASTNDNDITYSAADSISGFIVKPEFPGGLTALNAYLDNAINYKSIGAVYGTVTVQFIIDEKGKVASTSIGKGLNENVNNEVIRVIDRMPKWTPAQSANKNISVQVVMPIYFGN